MRAVKILSICVCFIVFTQAMWGQKANEAARPGIPGYLDPRTGAFRPTVPTEESPDLSTATVATTGSFVVNFTINVKSVLPSTDTIACLVDIVVSDATTTASPRFFNESAAVAATGTGATRLCKVTIPYSWALTTASTDMVSIDYTITAPGLFISTTNALPFRLSSLTPLAVIKVPASGATTTETVTATI